MLYPLSYGGARSQSSGLGVHLGRQGVAQVHLRRPGHVGPARDHPRSLHVTAVDLVGQAGAAGGAGCRRRGVGWFRPRHEPPLPVG